MIYFLFSYISNNIISNIDNIKTSQNNQNFKQSNKINKGNETVDLLNKKKNDEQNIVVNNNNSDSNLDLLDINNQVENNHTWLWGYTNNIQNFTNIYIVLNNINKEEKDILNKYLKKFKLIWSRDYKIHTIYSKNIDKRYNCQYTYKQSNFLSKLTPFDNSKKIIYSSLIKYFNKIKKSDNDKLFIFNNDNLDINCNSIKYIKKDIDKITYLNDNIYIINHVSNNNTNELKKEFFNQLSILTWVHYIKYKTKLELRNKLNDYIYPLENKIQINSDSKNLKINTYIEILDKNKEPYQANITTYKKEGGIFKPIKDDIYKKQYTDKLDAWIYKFIAYDPVTDIYLQTEPVIINKLNKFEKKFIFRKTRLVISIVDENDKPILWKIYIKGEEYKNQTQEKYEDKSNLTLLKKPWKYSVIIKTNNNYNFKDEFTINGEKTILKQYKTIKQNYKLRVIDKDWKEPKTMLFSIDKDWKLYINKKWNNVIVWLQLGQYVIKVIDPYSWNTINKELKVEDIDTITKTITLKMVSYPVEINFWKNWKIVKIYNRDMLNKSLKRVSWTWKKIINLSKWRYLLKIFNKNNQELKTIRFSVDDFLDNIVDISNLKKEDF